MANRTYKDVFALQYTDEFDQPCFKTYMNWNDLKAKRDSLSLYEIFFKDHAEAKSVFYDEDTNIVYRIYVFDQI